MKMYVFFKKPKKGIEKAINWFGKIKTGDSNSCHCGFAISGDAYESLVIGGVTKRNFNLAYNSKDVTLYEVGLLAADDEAVNDIYKFLESLLGSYSGIYGIAKIPLQAVDALLSFVARRKIFFATRLSSSKFFICAGLVSYSLYKYGNVNVQKLFKNWRSMSPDDIMDIFNLNPDLFILKKV